MGRWAQRRRRGGGGPGVRPLAHIIAVTSDDPDRATVTFDLPIDTSDWDPTEFQNDTTGAVATSVTQTDVAEAQFFNFTGGTINVGDIYDMGPNPGVAGGTGTIAAP